MYTRVYAQVICKFCAPLYRKFESVDFSFRDPGTNSFLKNFLEKCTSQHVEGLSAQLSEFKGLTHTAFRGNAPGNAAFEFTQEPTGELLLGIQLICK